MSRNWQILRKKKVIFLEWIPPSTKLSYALIVLFWWLSKFSTSDLKRSLISKSLRISEKLFSCCAEGLGFFDFFTIPTRNYIVIDHLIIIQVPWDDNLCAPYCFGSNHLVSYWFTTLFMNLVINLHPLAYNGVPIIFDLIVCSSRHSPGDEWPPETWIHYM